MQILCSAPHFSWFGSLMVRNIRWYAAFAFAIGLCFCAQYSRCIAADNIVIVLDDSGSMREKMKGSKAHRMDAAKQALIEVLKQLKADTNLGVRLLNGSRNKRHWVIPLGPISTNQAIASIESVRADGGTPLGDALREAADELLKLRETQKYGVYRLLVVTDGEATDANLLEAFLPDILSRGLIVDAIGVDMRQDHSLATRVHSYRRANDDEALKKAVVEVLAESSIDGANTSEADFQLLDALDNQTAIEALAALATVDNAPIAGKSKRASNSTSGNPFQSNGSQPINSAQATNSGSPQTNVRSSLLTTIVVVVFSACFLPLGLMIAILTLSLRRAKNSRSGGFRKY